LLLLAFILAILLLYLPLLLPLPMLMIDDAVVVVANDFFGGEDVNI
jgi:hypothetical protein